MRITTRKYDVNDKAEPAADHRKTIYTFAGPAVFALMLIAPLETMSYEIRCSIGLLIWMAIWWITRPVHLAVTGFLPLATVAIFDFNNIIMKLQLKRAIPVYLSFYVLILSLLPQVGYADLYPAQFQIPKIEKPPIIDGKLQVGEWEQCQKITEDTTNGVN